MTSTMTAPGARVATVEEIRSHFPALQRKHGGLPVAYFDGPGGTQVPRAVVEAMNDYMYHHNANTHWRYPTSIETDDAILCARECIADFIGASPNQVAFGRWTILSRRACCPAPAVRYGIQAISARPW